MPQQVGDNFGWRVYDPPREVEAAQPRPTWGERIAEANATREALRIIDESTGQSWELPTVPQVVDSHLTMLPRTGAKGQFVLYPKDWPPQWRDPRNRRYQTKCDMLAGPCSCGRRHLPEDGDVQENLQRYGCRIETIQQWRERLHNA